MTLQMLRELRQEEHARWLAEFDAAASAAAAGDFDGAAQHFHRAQEIGRRYAALAHAMVAVTARGHGHG